MEIGPTDVDTDVPWDRRDEVRADAWKRYARRRRIPSMVISSQRSMIAHLWPVILERADDAVAELEAWLAPMTAQIASQAERYGVDPNEVALDVDHWYAEQEQWDALIALPSWKHLFQGDAS